MNSGPTGSEGRGLFVYDSAVEEPPISYDFLPVLSPSVADSVWAAKRPSPCLAQRSIYMNLRALERERDRLE